MKSHNRHLIKEETIEKLTSDFLLRTSDTLIVKFSFDYISCKEKEDYFVLSTIQ